MSSSRVSPVRRRAVAAIPFSRFAYAKPPFIMTARLESFAAPSKQENPDRQVFPTDGKTVTPRLRLGPQVAGDPGGQQNISLRCNCCGIASNPS
jgi:hypothetical protein